MSTKPVFPCALLVAVLAIGSVQAQAQDYSAPPGPSPGAPPQPLMTGTNEVPPPTAVAPPAKPDDWICYTCPDCCGPVGGNGPILYELFLRTGPSLDISGGFLKNSLAAGWMVEGGGRSLFFNPDHDRAWTIELALSHVYNNGNRPDFQTAIIEQPQGATAPGPVLVSVGSLQRTDINVGGGAEWWLIGQSGSCKPCWWVGADAGFRYGVSRLDLHQNVNPGITFTRTEGINSGPYIAAHSDVSWQCGYCQYILGVRAEWDKSYMSMLPLVNCNIEDVNFLLNFAVRY
jgi:hypothetical protein